MEVIRKSLNMIALMIVFKQEEEKMEWESIAKVMRVCIKHLLNAKHWLTLLLSSLQ